MKCSTYWIAFAMLRNYFVNKIGQKEKKKPCHESAPELKSFITRSTVLDGVEFPSSVFSPKGRESFLK